MAPTAVAMSGKVFVVGDLSGAFPVLEFNLGPVWVLTTSISQSESFGDEGEAAKV